MKKNNIEKILKNSGLEQKKWIDEEIKWLNDAQEERFYWRLYTLIPLKIVPIFGESDIMKAIDQKKFWEEERGVNKDSCPEALANALMTLQENCLIYSDWGFMDNKRGKWHLHYSEEYDTYFRTCTYLEEIYSNCLVNILLND